MAKDIFEEISLCEAAESFEDETCLNACRNAGILSIEIIFSLK